LAALEEAEAPAAAAEATVFFTLATAPEAFALIFFAVSLALANEGRAGRNGIAAEFWCCCEVLQLWSDGNRCAGQNCCRHV
jgi:hypothetical protein